MKRITLSLLVAFALVGCTSDGSGGSGSAADQGPNVTTSSTTSTSPPARCRTNYPTMVLPRWARAGFSGRKPSVPYVLGDGGDIAAIVWVSHHPLAAPPAAGKNNKILGGQERCGCRAASHPGRIGRHQAGSDSYRHPGSGTLGHRPTVGRLLVV